ncbi:MAG: YifB family Mg chelatase-like AAA ATPase [bacterium]
MLSHVFSAALSGIDATIVKVEVDVQMSGLPGWSMVGLLETAVKEARERVGSAIRNSGYSLPNRKTIVNLSPADLKKAGAHYDLAIAVGLLTAVGVCRPSSRVRLLLAGELSLTGKVMPINGALLMALAARERGLDGIVLPAENAWEAMLAGIDKVVAVESLADAVEFINGGEAKKPPPSRPRISAACEELDLSDVRGQPFAKRGLEIAASGGHNLALMGPPGTGKTMLAERLPTILPPLSEPEALEVLKIRSWHGLIRDCTGLPDERPFRAPHHSASYAGLVGGGTAGMPRLGEISLAHNGVLFLDEMAEFRKDVLEVLRQPLESGWVRIVRAGVSVAYPARFMLVAAFNPCRCGWRGHPTRPCICNVREMRLYRSKLSGPLLDRLDLHVELGPPPHDALLDSMQEERSQAVRERVLAARDRQHARYKGTISCNAQLSGRAVSRLCALPSDARGFLKTAASKMSLSARAVHRVIKVARTIADLAGSGEIASSHIAEALQFRPGLEEL